MHNMAKLTIEVAAEELEKALDSAYQKQKKTGFRITGHSLEFTGLCPECSKKNTDEK